MYDAFIFLNRFMDCWLRMGTSKENENTKQQLHDTKETDGTTSTLHVTKTNYKRNLHILTAV
jgi:hypothetical protein